MNLLALVNRARVECGVSGPALTVVTSLTGEASRMLNWVISAWVDIQTEHEDWQYLRTAFEFNLVAQQQEYTSTDAGVSATFGSWKRDSFRISSVGQSYADEQLTEFMDYNTFRDLYQYGNMRTTYARPVVVSITPNQSLAFGCNPDQAYVVTGEYYVKPVELSAATDEPNIPSRYHMLIVYRAMMYYGGYEAAPEVYQRGELEFKRLNSRLQIAEMEDIISGPPLA